MNKSILLIIGGGIAAYKSLELIRLLKKQGIGVKAILTKAGEQFVTPLSVGSLTGEKVYSDLFNLTDEQEMGHIELSRSADLVVVAPATADLMAKLANGLANDLASTALLATNKPVLMAPAMNVRMWRHAATQRNLARLKSEGIRFVGPADGEMACGEFGPGRLAEPDDILSAINAALNPQKKLLTGKRVLITAGPTREPIDPVRFISNQSSGKQGYALADMAARMGAEVTLVSGPVGLAAPKDVRLVSVTTADEMLRACEAALPASLAIFCAAVADWKVVNAAPKKMKKETGAPPPQLAFAPNPDILKTISHLNQGRPRLVVGFAAETDNVIENAKTKLKAKGCDLIVANDVSNGVFDADMNAVHLVTAKDVQNWPQMNKQDVARGLLEFCAAVLK